VRDAAAGILLAAAILAGSAQPAAGQSGQGSSPPDQSEMALDDTIEAGEAEDEAPARRLVNWNEYDGRLWSIRIGAGYLVESATYSQDDNSKAQFDLAPEFKIRDARFVFNGRLKFKRPVTWTAGVMYDGPNDTWLVRQTGIMIDVPEIWGQVFVGRGKEGFSMSKVMVGYAGFTMERATINDAAIPLFGDGVKWLGYVPSLHLLWNLGFYGDWLSEDQSWSSYDRQISGRIAWLPIMSASGGRLLHVGFNARTGKPDDGELRLRSRPEAFPAPYFVETPTFAADGATTTGIEIYYRPGSLLFGTEYYLQMTDAPASDDPRFHGGELISAWLITGETRVYNTRGGYFNQVSPARPVFTGGPGAWELVGRFSYSNLDSKSIRGGTFWRITPMVNWHLSDHVRFEAAYGYGSLDRFDVTGTTHFFQTRLQLQF
jgi:phosphate-selective porin OprO and OprP